MGIPITTTIARTTPTTIIEVTEDLSNLKESTKKKVKVRDGGNRVRDGCLNKYHELKGYVLSGNHYITVLISTLEIVFV